LVFLHYCAGTVDNVFEGETEIVYHSCSFRRVAVKYLYYIGIYIELKLDRTVAQGNVDINFSVC
jgi:hypothetical protein